MLSRQAAYGLGCRLLHNLLLQLCKQIFVDFSCIIYLNDNDFFEIFFPKTTKVSLRQHFSISC